MATMTLTFASHQQGQGLVQCMIGMSLSLLVVMTAFSAFAWIQRSQTQIQTQIDLHQRLHTSFQLVRERVLCIAASALRYLPVKNPLAKA